MGSFSMNRPLSIAAAILTCLVVLGCDRGVPKQSSASTAKQPVADGVVAVGNAAPSFSFRALDDKDVGLGDFAGKVVLLNFWATWCVPCVEEMPALERLQKRFGGEGLTIVSINVDPDENLEAVKQFVATNGITFPVLRDPNFSLAPQFGVSGFPESFFLDKQGRFLAAAESEGAAPTIRFVGDRAWDSPQFFAMVERLLAEQKK